MNTADTYMGDVHDSYGRKIEVWADRSGAVRLGLGLADLMLPAHAWAQLKDLGDRGQALRGPDLSPCPECGAFPGEPCDPGVLGPMYGGHHVTA